MSSENMTAMDFISILDLSCDASVCLTKTRQSFYCTLSEFWHWPRPVRWWVSDSRHFTDLLLTLRAHSHAPHCTRTVASKGDLWSLLPWLHHWLSFIMHGKAWAESRGSACTHLNVSTCHSSSLLPFVTSSYLKIWFPPACTPDPPPPISGFTFCQ